MLIYIVCIMELPKGKKKNFLKKKRKEQATVSDS